MKKVVSLLAVGAFWLSACTLQIPTDLTPTSGTPTAETSTTAEETPSTPAAGASEALTTTDSITDTEAVSETTAITGSSALTDSEAITDTEAVTETAAVTGSSTMTDSEAITDTEAVSETAAVTASTTLTDSEAITDTEEATATATFTLPDTSNMTVAEIVQSVGNFSRLREAVDEAELTSALSGRGPVTLFVPGNAAFEGVAPEAMAVLMAAPDLLTTILQYHVVADELDSVALAQLDTLQTVAGEPITVTIDINGHLLLNDAQIVYANIPATNGVVHVINQILTPPSSDLGLPVVNPDLIAVTNYPADDTLEQLKRADTSEQTIVEVIQSISGLTTAATAINATGFNELLEGDGPFTLFIPTNPAFQELPEDELAALLNDKDALAAVLQQHVVEGIVTSADLEELPTLTNEAGDELTIVVQDNGRILVNGAPVYQADIEAANGMIHVIGKVLIPAE